MTNCIRKVILSVFLLSLYIMIAIPLPIANSLYLPYPLLKVNVDSPHLTAGNEEEIEISIKNIGDRPAYGVKASLSVPQNVVGISIVEQSHRVFREIEKEETKYLNPLLYVASTTPPGAYSLTLSLVYQTYTDIIQIGVIVDSVKPMPIMSVDTVGSKMTSGSPNNLEITIANEGTSEVLSLDVVLTLPTPGPLAITSSDNQWHFKSINPDNSVVIETEITVAEDAFGPYQLGLTLNYRDPTGYTYVETRTLGISVSLEAPSSLVSMTSYSTSLDTFHQEENFTIGLNITNLGDSPAEAVRVDLVVPIGFAPLSATTTSIGDLLPGSTIPSEFEIFISSMATPGIAYMLEFDITYTDSLGREQITRTYVGILVQGRLELIIYDIEVNPPILTQGSELAISGTILNRGNVDAKYTNVTILPRSLLNPMLGSTEYIGAVRPDAPVSFEVNANIDSKTKIGTYSIPIKVSYEDDRYVKHSLTEKIQIRVVEKLLPSQYETFQIWLFTNGWMYVVVAVVITVIPSISYLRNRNRARRAT